MDNKLSAEDAVKDEDRSIALEDRFENEMDKARALEMLNRNNDDAKATRAKAMSLGTQQQVHGYGRQLQQQKKYDEALEVFRANIKLEIRIAGSVITKRRVLPWRKAITIRR